MDLVTILLILMLIRIIMISINLNTINKFFSKTFKSLEAEKFLKKISIKNKKNNNFQSYQFPKLKKAYENFIKANYQAINKSYPNKFSVAKRIPIRFNKKNHYIEAKYKYMPKKVLHIC